jgi:hypothetical protein
VDTDATEDTLGDAVDRLVQRAMALAREISPAWQMLCGDVKAKTKQEGNT